MADYVVFSCNFLNKSIQQWATSELRQDAWVGINHHASVLCHPLSLAGFHGKAFGEFSSSTHGFGFIALPQLRHVVIQGIIWIGCAQ